MCASRATVWTRFGGESEVSETPSFVHSILIESGCQDNHSSATGMLNINFDSDDQLHPIMQDSTLLLVTFIVLEGSAVNQLIIHPDMELFVIPRANLPELKIKCDQRMRRNTKCFHGHGSSSKFTKATKHFGSRTLGYLARGINDSPTICVLEIISYK